MRKPVYKYPDFVIDVELDKTDSKRFLVESSSLMSLKQKEV
jgi:hypothetical protein